MIDLKALDFDHLEAIGQEDISEISFAGGEQIEDVTSTGTPFGK